jgi:acyl-CoA synthetase (NDP forming)
MGFPVVLKLLSDTITHKTEVGGVTLDLRTKRDVERAFAQIRDNVAEIGRESEMQGVTVQEMVTEGVEVILGMSEDRTFGPLIVFGTGGVYAELFKDVTFRIHPLTDADAAEMVRSVKAHRLLEGWRGSPPSDVQALEDLLLRISAMIEDLPQISEMDLNPVKVRERGKGYVVVDARIMLTEP